ncbi:MAG: CAP domain-containing protein [Tolypothrix carrinoi HA7290-LM1]|nr:CAP domain-containing protein [Tolypothrix carrinoi HA7290-LM1]
MSHAGYKWSEIAENVAAGQKTPEQAVSIWINEVPPNDAHRRNILNPNYRELGVGYSNNYWTQDFGSPAY